MNQVKQLINETRKYLTKYDYDRVIECCDKILELDPNSTFGLRFNAIAHSQNGDRRKGLEYYERLYELSPDDDTIYDMAYVYEKVGCYEKALNFYDKNSENTWIMLKRRHQLTKLERFQEIIDDYDNNLLMKLNSSDDTKNILMRMVLLEERGVFQYRNKDYSKARETFEEVLALYAGAKSEIKASYKKQFNSWYKRLREYLGKYPDAAEFFRKFFTYDDVWNVKLDTSIYYVSISITYADLLLELNLDNKDLLIKCAIAYRSFDNSYALDCLYRILELEPENTWAIKEILDIYSYQYSKDRSLHLINQKLYIEDIRTDLLYRKIKLLESMTLYDEALSGYDEYLRCVDDSTDPKLTESDRLRCLEQKALEYYMDDNLQESYNIYKQAANISKKIMESDKYNGLLSYLYDWYEQVLLESITKSNDNPSNFFEEYYNINNKTLELWIDKINYLNSSYRLGNPIDYCNILLKKNRNNIDLLLTKAYVYYSTEEYEKALNIYNKLIKHDDNNKAKNYKFNILIKHHQYIKAYKLLTQMNVEYPIINNNLYLLAEKLQDKRKYDESLQVYETIFRLTERINIIDNIKYLMLKTENTQKLYESKYYNDWIELINPKYKSNTTCPTCGNKLIPILYGLPSPEAMEGAEKGEIILGGCCVSWDDPTHHCKKCNKDVYMDPFQIDITRDDLNLAAYTTTNIYWITRYIEQHPDNMIEKLEKEAYKKGIDKDELTRFIEKLEEIKHIKKDNYHLNVIENGCDDDE